MLRIIVLNWNDGRSTIGAVDSILSEVGQYETILNEKYEIVIVDNFSDDDSYALLQDYIESSGRTNLKIMQTNENLGYAGGNNFALFKLLEDTDYFLISNNDVIFREGSIECLLGFLSSNPNAGAVGPIIYDEFGVQSAGKLIDLVWGRHKAYKQKIDTPKKVDYVSGACMMFRASLLSEVGGLDENFFMYTEDLDFCFRLHKLGYQNYCVPRSSVFHSSKGSIRGRHASVNFRVYYQLRNNILFSKKHMANCNMVRYQSGVMMRGLKKIIIQCIDGNWSVVKVVFNALADGWKKNV